jgi:serine/threonine protein kinase
MTGSDGLDSPQGVLSDLLSLLDSMGVAGDSVEVYRKHISFARLVIRKSWIPHLKFQEATVTRDYIPLLCRIRSDVESLQETLRMTTKDIWWQHIALDWSIRQIPQDLKERMDSIAKLLRKFEGPGARKFKPPARHVSKDYQTLYQVFDKSDKTNPKVQERFDSVQRFLEERAIPKPDSQANPQYQLLAQTFGQIKDFQLSHSDFQVEAQIGHGASGKVYRGIQISTGRVVAIKELYSLELKSYQAISLRREIACLAAIRHPYLVDFLGATVKAPYWVVTEFMPGKSLFHRLRQKPHLTGLTLTVIAYETALAMQYLHSQGIIHRDLKTLNVLLDANNEPRLCDFGLARRVDSEQPMTGMAGTFNYMAPEVIKKGTYGLKADVFSFGMMLWEMATRKLPFQECDHQIQIAMAIERGDRPPMSKHISPGLGKLIMQCWDEDPTLRPTFQDICRRMATEKVAFDGAAAVAIREFYTRKDAASPSANDEELVLKLIEKPTPDLIPCLQRINNSANQIAKLRGTPFISLATPQLQKIRYPAILAYTLICVMKTAFSVTEFVGAGGIAAINYMLASGQPENVKYGIALLRHCSYSLQAVDAKACVSALLGIRQWDVAVEIARRAKVELTELIEANLAAIVAEPSDNECHRVLLSVISPRMALGVQKTQMLDRLFEIEAFTKQLDESCLAMLKQLINDERSPINQRKAALRFLKGYPLVAIEKLIGDTLFVVRVMKTDPESWLLLHICRQRPDVVWQHIGLFEKARATPAFADVLLELTKTHQQDVVGLEWVFHGIVKLLNGREFVEVPLRILLELSKEADFGKVAEVKEPLFGLLESGECTIEERTMLFSIFLNAKGKENEWVNHYSHLLAAAESMLEYSPIALRIIATQRLPAPDTRYSGRALAAIRLGLQSKSVAGQVAACEVLLNMAKKKAYVARVATLGFNIIIGEVIAAATDLQLVLMALTIVREFTFTMTVDVKAIALSVVKTASEKDAVVAGQIKAIAQKL